MTAENSLMKQEEEPATRERQVVSDPRLDRFLVLRSLFAADPATHPMHDVLTTRFPEGN
jgi:hypothetical protein